MGGKQKISWFALSVFGFIFFPAAIIMTSLLYRVYWDICLLLWGCFLVRGAACIPPSSACTAAAGGICLLRKAELISFIPLQARPAFCTDVSTQGGTFIALWVWGFFLDNPGKIPEQSFFFFFVFFFLSSPYTCCLRAALLLLLTS